jgi:hypothetical protein
MNPLKLKASLLLLLGGLLTASTASAALLTYQPGDIFLGFRSTNPSVTRSYLVNIGPGSSFRDATTTLSLGNYKADLDTVFGSTWVNDAQVSWSVIGTNSAGVGANVDGDPVKTLYSTLAGNGAIPLSPPVGPPSSFSGQAAPAQKIVSMKDNWLTYSAAAGTGVSVAPNSSFTTSGDSSSYATFAGGTAQPFSYFSTALEGNFGAGTAGTSLDLFRNIPASSTTRGSYEGTFLIDGAGNVTFNQIPEPSGAICLVLSGLALGTRRRRSSNR